MTKYILIGGYIHKAQDGGKSFCEELTKGIQGRSIKILDCLFARDEDSWESRFMDDKDFFQNNLKNFEIELASPEKFIAQVKNSDVIFFQGGVPRKLMSHLDSDGDWKKELDGKILVGSSGGADAVVKYYGVGKTSNIGEGLGLLPIKFIPHWESLDYAEGTNIDWNALFEKLKSYKEYLEVVTVRDGEFVVFDT